MMKPECDGAGFRTVLMTRLEDAGFRAILIARAESSSLNRSIGKMPSPASARFRAVGVPRQIRDTQRMPSLRPLAVRLDARDARRCQACTSAAPRLRVRSRDA